MSESKLGTTPTEESRRDAVHVAIYPCVAGEMLERASSVWVHDGKAYPANSHKSGVGIVDPFGQMFVRTGERFWLLLEPGSVSSLRHSWAHPMFPIDTEVEQ